MHERVLAKLAENSLAVDTSPGLVQKTQTDIDEKQMLKTRSLNCLYDFSSHMQVSENIKTSKSDSLITVVKCCCTFANIWHFFFHNVHFFPNRYP